MCLTSPPYWGQRYYGDLGPDQLGIERDYWDYINKLVAIFGEAKRVLKDTGSIWIVIGDTYNGYKRGNTNGIAEKGSTIGRSKAGLVQANSRSYKIPQKGVPIDSLLKIPFKLAIELEAKHGLIHRDTIIWHKPNAMPESVTSRYGKAYECILFFTKAGSGGYYFKRSTEPLKTPKKMLASKSTFAFGGRKDRVSGYDMPTYSGKTWGGSSPEERAKKNLEKRQMRNVWSIPTNASCGDKKGTAGHFAPFPTALCERIIQDACPVGGTVLDPFMGSGSSGVAALKLSCNFVGIDLNPEYVELARGRLAKYHEIATTVPTTIERDVAEQLQS